MTEDEFDRVMNVNVKSIYHSVNVAVPALKQRGGGAIINIASIGAMRPRPGLVWYNASKGAVANVSCGVQCLSMRLLANELLRPRKVLLQNSGKIKSESTHCAHSSQALACFQHSLASSTHLRT